MKYEYTYIKLATPSDFIVDPKHVRVAPVNVAIQKSGLSETIIRLYDDYGVKGRLCVHLKRGSVTMTIRHEQE